MFPQILNVAFCSAVVLSLFLFDYALGNGLVDLVQKLSFKIVCFIKKVIRDEEKNLPGNVGQPMSFAALMTEIILLSLTFAFLNKYKKFRGKDTIDELLQESRETLRQTNEFLDKWRLRRLPTEFSYLDEEPQEIVPLKLEVPILHMAIIDTTSKTRSQLERGDAGDTVNVTNATLLSMTSLMDDEMESISDGLPIVEEKTSPDDSRNMEFQSRFLWDVIEEDVNSLDG